MGPAGFGPATKRIQAQIQFGYNFHNQAPVSNATAKGLAMRTPYQIVSTSYSRISSSFVISAMDSIWHCATSSRSNGSV